MPRTLPWLLHAKQAQPKKSSSPASAPKRKRAATPDGDLVDSDLNSTGVVTPQRRERQRLARSPSTSPPPAPPEVEYMREGYTADDIWMMVEDEFFSTAQSFTQHIHHAEYVRLKKLAKARGADTLQAIARPTDGRTAQSTGTKLKLGAEEKARKIKSGLKGMGVEDESDADEDDYIADPQLAGLMGGSQRSAQDLTGMAKPKAKTRAAAGFTKSPRKARPKAPQAAAQASTSNGTARKQQRPISEDEGSSDSEDDLDKASSKVTQTKVGSAAAKHRPSNGGSVIPAKKHDGPSAPGFFKRFADAPQTTKRSAPSDEPQASRNSANTVSSTTKEAVPISKDQDSEDTTFTQSARSQATQDFLAKRRAREAAKQKSKDKEEKQKVRGAVDIPTFAI